MIHTFDFVFVLWKKEQLREKVNSLMQMPDDQELDINGWRLHFDQKRRWVVISNNGSDAALAVKFQPAEMSYETLLRVMDPDHADKTMDNQVRYLDN